MRLTDLHPRWTMAGGPWIYSPTGQPCPSCPRDQIDPACRTCFGHGREYVPATPRRGVGISFDCPAGHPADCAYDEVSGDRTHERHYVAFRNPLDGGPPFEPGRALWDRVGDTFETLQLSPSILSDVGKGGCGWHGYIGLTIPGEVTTC